MSQNFSPQGSMRPLSVGNVVSAGIRLYRSHLKLYFGIALRATLWSILPFFIIGALAAIVIPLISNGASASALLLFLILIPIFLYCLAKYLTNSALISRLAFSELVNQPESVKFSRSQLNPRLWSFLMVALQVFILLILVYLGLAILAGIVFGIFAFLFGQIFGQIVGIFIGSIFAVVIVLFGSTWFFSRWIVSEVPLAVEEGINGGQSISRSWELTQNSVFRVQGVVLVAFLVTLPLLLVTSYIPQIFLVGIEQGSSLYWTVYLISLIASIFGGAVVTPFWQSIKAVLYYDLRSRREGLGLQLRNRPF